MLGGRFAGNVGQYRIVLFLFSNTDFKKKKKKKKKIASFVSEYLWLSLSPEKVWLEDVPASAIAGGEENPVQLAGCVGRIDAVNHHLNIRQ